MSHSHIPIRHLLKRIETDSPNRRKRDMRPPWLVRFIEDAAQLFEPFHGVGRVGFDCSLLDDEWVVGIYLGGTEIVGGPLDGKTVFANFCFDLAELIRRFDEVHALRWTALPEPIDLDQPGDEPDGPARERSYVTVSGQVGGHSVRLSIFSIPPDMVQPALRRWPDGTYEPA
ncbi:MAG TPA: hypothetical protein EYP14_02260 [Planctomycetaceae bacterium]|nr:hypothetical protein [Planctomycetaceae bacterium]